MDSLDYTITTIDNPFNPFTEFDKWFQYDIYCGHRTCEKLARLACTSNVLSDEENDIEIKSAIDQMIVDEPLIYKKIYDKAT